MRAIRRIARRDGPDRFEMEKWREGTINLSG